MKKELEKRDSGSDECTAGGWYGRGCGQTNTANSTATSGDAATIAQTEAAQSNTDNGDLTVVKILGRIYAYTGANRENGVL